MGGWMDGWDRLKDGWMDRWVNGQIDGLMMDGV